MKKAIPKNLIEYGEALLKVTLPLWDEVDKTRLRQLMRTLGFKTPRHKNLTGEVFIHETKGFVFKKAYYPEGYAAPKNAVPTHFICKNSVNYDEQYVFAIQPLVDVSREAVKLAREKIPYSINSSYESSLWGTDPHDHNIGLYCGKPVVIDW